MTVRFTDEQRVAIERRAGDLLLDAGAGSGKTSVLVERFARAVLEDGVDVGRILTITFTEKAAAELRERIRTRLRASGGDDAARATEGAYISTIHAFCARVLRTHALDAGLDPGFTVLEAHEADELAGAAFDGALAAAAETAGGAELIASHGPSVLRGAIEQLHDELRSRGALRPSLPALTPAFAPGVAVSAVALAAAHAAAIELGAIADPPVRVRQALAALERAESVLVRDELWPGDLRPVELPARNGASALKTEACDAYREALDAVRAATERAFAETTRDALDALLGAYADRYAALKAARSAVDFEDLELLARELLARPEVGDRYRQRFRHVMVDELQDTNRVQLELIDLVAGGPESVLFMVGDAQQSIYGFRHAEVELFEERGRALAERGARASLQTNFRSRAEILTTLNVAFGTALGERFRPLTPGRIDEPADGPFVELRIVDKAADWETEGLAAPWRVAEARSLAARVRALIDDGSCTPGEVVVLTRATTDLRAYERALEDAGVPTYVIGGRGYWTHPQVVELVAYLRALVNPFDQEPYWTVLVSPLCGLSLDGLVLVAAGAGDELVDADAERLRRFESWFADERAAAARTGIEELLDRAIERTGYDLAILAMPGGRRRLANVRKLMRLGREWEAAAGTDLPGFLRMVDVRMGDGGAGSARESEAPVEGEGLDAVRLMTIHRAKGLEFPVVCVADLGRGPNFRPPLVRIGADGRRLGLRLARPGTAARIPALDYRELEGEQRLAEEAEERRLFYVAMTRAQERLILSGAAKMDTWEKGNTSRPIDWIAPAFVPEIASRVGEPWFTTGLGVRVEFITAPPELRPESGDSDALVCPGGTFLHPGSDRVPAGAPATEAGVSVSTLSYSAINEYERCGYRFYAERVLGLPALARDTEGSGVSATARGTLIHRILEVVRLDAPVLPDDAPPDVATSIERFLASATAARLGACAGVRREQRFAFPLAGQPGTLITGTFDVLADEGTQLLVVDYKTGRRRDYALQRVVYGLAALHAGAERVEVVHCFLDDPDDPVTETFTADTDRPRLERALAGAVAGIAAGRFEVSPVPQRSLCAGCPAAGGLCSWPEAMTSRLSPDRLF